MKVFLSINKENPDSCSYLEANTKDRIKGQPLSLDEYVYYRKPSVLQFKSIQNKLVLNIKMILFTFLLSNTNINVHFILLCLGHTTVDANLLMTSP